MNKNKMEPPLFFRTFTRVPVLKLNVRRARCKDFSISNYFVGYLEKPICILYNENSIKDKNEE